MNLKNTNPTIEERITKRKDFSKVSKMLKSCKNTLKQRKSLYLEIS